MAIPASMIHFKEWEKQSNPDVRYVPTTFDTFVTLMICMLGHDFVFYHGHKLLHHRSIYKYIHKKHHEWQAPIAAAAEYAHPVEHAITGLFSASLGLIITAAPIPVFWLWFTWLGFQVQNDHSGYHFPLMFSPEFHDYHHLKWVFIILDSLEAFDVVTNAVFFFIGSIPVMVGWVFGIGFGVRILSFKERQYTRTGISDCILRNPLGKSSLTKRKVNKKLTICCFLLYVCGLNIRKKVWYTIEFFNMRWQQRRETLGGKRSRFINVENSRK